MPTYKVHITEHFKKQLKYLLKKNLSLRLTLGHVLRSFNKSNEIFIGQGVYKVRLAGQSKGKSGGYRLFVLILEVEGLLTPLCIYSKSDKDDLNKAELSYHLNKVDAEIKGLL